MILRIERNPNCIELEPTELREMSSPVELSRLRVRWKSMPDGTERLAEEFVWADIWGWSSQEGGSRACAFAQRVIDPEGDEGIIIYGGDWGVKILVKNEEIGRNVLWVAIDIAHDNLPPEVLDRLGLNMP
ncbi:MAG: hypothetical protein ACRERE_19550 [Candidatus Entotheonellia bacterium]